MFFFFTICIFWWYEYIVFSPWLPYIEKQRKYGRKKGLLQLYMQYITDHLLHLAVCMSCYCDYLHYTHIFRCCLQQIYYHLTLITTFPFNFLLIFFSLLSLLILKSMHVLQHVSSQRSFSNVHFRGVCALHVLAFVWHWGNVNNEQYVCNRCLDAVVFAITRWNPACASMDCTGSLCNTTDVAEWFAAWVCDKVNLAFADSLRRGRGETRGTKGVVISLGQNNF